MNSQNLVAVLLICIGVILRNVYSANILYIAPLASPSHYLWNKVLALELVGNGHNVTMLTHDLEEKDMVENYTVITISGFYEYSYKHFSADQIMTDSFLNKIVFPTIYTKLLCDYDFNSSAFYQLLEYPQDFKFDIILFDITGPVCLYGFITRFHNPPVIAVSAFALAPHIAYGFSNPLYTSYLPYYSTMYTNKMSFSERMFNVVYTYLDIFLNRYISTEYQYSLARNAFNISIPQLTDIERNISLYLTNTDPVIDYPIPLLPNIIPVGGLQIKPPKCLSQDLENVFNNAEHGVIYFSLGTNINSTVFTEENINVFLNVFQKLRQVIIWKFDVGNLENVPENVVIRKWLPQNDILGHPKTKLFISHCGVLSVQEAVYHAVPVVGIPYFIDQWGNTAKLTKKGVATYLNKKNLTYENVYSAITEILNNPKYTLEIKSLSEKFKNQINSPLERAVFWVEHVLKYGDTSYLNVPGRDMTFYQLNNLDIITFFILSLLILFYTIYFVLKAAFLYTFNKIKSKVD